MKLNKLRSVQFVEFAAAMLVTLPLYLLPRIAALRLGEWIGAGMYCIMSRRRAIGYRNLTLAFGETLSDEEKHQILRITFRNLGKSLLEVIHFPKMSRREILEKVTIVGQEHYLAARAKGRGVLCLTAHCGNWEMSSHAQSAAGYPLSIVVRQLDNRWLDHVATKLRTLHGNTLLARKDGLKHILAALKNNASIGILMDQNTLRSKGIFVDFFGKPACTIPVIAVLALRYNVPVIPTFIVRTGFDTHTLYIFPEVALQRTGDARHDIAVNTAHFNQIIEEFIRQHPDQWFWIHNRWKTQPALK
jgi:Kdo2-lipid IVA lauroyltransferase/acyltransferase